MKGISKGLSKVFLVFALILSFVFSSSVNVSAAYEALTELETTLIGGSYTAESNSRIFDYAANRYKMKTGGYLMWSDLFSEVGTDKEGADYLNVTNLDKLTAGSKRSFIEDLFRIANAVAYDNEANGVAVGSDKPTTETVRDLYEIVQDEAGMAGTLLASIMQNTKPDYATANKIYEPFSGVVGTILGVIAVFIMALLGITMALDIAYITIPAFQMAIDSEGDGSSEGGKGSGAKGFARVISNEAHAAMKSNESEGKDGNYKAAVGTYFKYRWKGLVLLGICLLYLVQGQIYSFVGWFIDLFSGFLGF